MTTALPPTPLGVARAVWRRFRTMRTAIVLLLLLGAGAAVGSLFPQRPVDPAAVDRWKDANAAWASIAEGLGLFDVFGSWWFMAIYGLLLVSLLGCLLPRYRAFARALRSRPAERASLSSLDTYRSRAAALPAPEVMERARRLLRERRFRIEGGGTSIAAEKGHWREGGSLVFHSAFFVLLIGMSMGKLFGFSGQAAVLEGERFTDTHTEYDFVEEGRYFGERHEGFGLALDDFDVSWHPNGVPRRFVADVRLSDAEDRFIRRERIVVNSPLTHDGRRVYLLSWGWAPEIRVTQRGRVLYDGATVFLNRDGVWRGAVKVPSTKPFQTGFDLIFFADPAVEGDDVFERSPEPRNPLVVFQQFVGDLRLDRPQSVYELDPLALAPADAGPLTLGTSESLSDGIEIAFTGLRQYAVFQIASNPGAPVLLAAAVMILVGLIPALYSSRRRVWVRVGEESGATRLEIAGVALQRRAAFEEEFAALVRDLDRELVPPDPERALEPMGEPRG